MIVSPDHDKIRLEVIKRGANFLKALEQSLTVFGCFCLSLIGSPFLLHLLWPVRRLLQVSGDSRIS